MFYREPRAALYITFFLWYGSQWNNDINSTNMFFHLSLKDWLFFLSIKNYVIITWLIFKVSQVYSLHWPLLSIPSNNNKKSFQYCNSSLLSKG